MKRTSQDEDPSEEEGSEETEETSPEEGTGPSPAKPGKGGKTAAAEEAEAARPKESFSTRMSRWGRTYRFHISVALAIIGFFLFFFGLFGWTPIATSGPLSSVEQVLLGSNCDAGSNYVNGACTSTSPDWTLAMIPGGGLLGAVGAYLAITYTVARRRFEHLMKTKSKAEFLRNVTEAEDLLWDLTPEDEIRLVRKKQDLKIRT